MKSLSLAKPLVLVVIGHPGSGKSFFSRQFSDTFNAPRVSYDTLSHLVKPLSVTNQKAGQKVIINILSEQISELLKSQKTFIVDGIGSTKTERLSLRKQANEAGYDTLLVWVQTDEATTRYRSVSRKQEDQEALSLDEYSKAVKRFTPPLANEPHVVISGKHTYATQAKVVLKKLVMPREQSIQNRSIVNHDDRVPTAKPSDSSDTARRGIMIR
jgi:predicted kinase